MAIDIPSLLQDPEFKALSSGEKRQLLSEGDPEFASLSDQDIEAFVQPNRSSKLAPSGRTPEQEALAQQFIRSEQRPTLEKSIAAALGIGGALVNPFVQIAKAVPALPEIAADPTRLLPTAAEAARRTGIDIVEIAKGLGKQGVSLGKTAAPALLKGGIPAATVDIARQVLNSLNPRTPSESEVETFLEEAPFEQAIAEERQKTAFAGAQPQLAEAITQVVEFAPPIKGISALRGVSVAKAAPSRILRAAAKPPKQLGARFEKATEESLSDIFHHNPNADKLGSMPLEGFQQTVASLQKQVGAEIDQGLKASGIPIAGGDEIAKALTERAAKLEKAGQPAANVQTIRDRAADFVGKVDDIESLRESTTMANRELSPLFQRSREMANPARAQADTIANEIIAKTGGGILNQALESVAGPQGAKLRKQWSNLTMIEKAASDQLNKIINSAPAEIQSALTSSLTSLEGAAGLVGLVQGYAAGVIPVATAAAKAWQKNAARALKDSNALVTSAYEKLRANPPPVAQRVPPVIPAAVPPPLPPGPMSPTLSSSIAGITPAPSPTLGPILPVAGAHSTRMMEAVRAQQAQQELVKQLGEALAAQEQYY